MRRSCSVHTGDGSVFLSPIGGRRSTLPVTHRNLDDPGFSSNATSCESRHLPATIQICCHDLANLCPSVPRVCVGELASIQHTCVDRRIDPSVLGQASVDRGDGRGVLNADREALGQVKVLGFFSPREQVV